MAGTTRLELATSAVTGTFNDIEEHGRHRKSLEVHHRQRYLCIAMCIAAVSTGALNPQQLLSLNPCLYLKAI